MVAPLAVKFKFPPTQMVLFNGDTVIVGFGFTVKVAVCVGPLHPTLEPITEYTVVTFGFAITALPDVVFKPVPGDQT